MPIIQKELYDIDLAPKIHIVDTAYVDLDLLVSCKKSYDIDLIGPPKEGPTWRSKIEGGYTMDKFTINWEKQEVVCPQNKVSLRWKIPKNPDNKYIVASFSTKNCKQCPARDLCINTDSTKSRRVVFAKKEQYQARESLLEQLKTKAGKKPRRFHEHIKNNMLTR